MIKNIKKHSHCGSDHFFHLSLINRIKFNNNKFIQNDQFTTNENFPFYPQLFHYILSFFDKKVYYNYNLINRGLLLIEFVLSLILFQIFFNFSEKTNFVSLFTYLILSYTIPQGGFFSWNSINRGISPRIFGSISILLFFIIYFATDDSTQIIFNSLLIIIIFLSSQFAFQYLIFFGIIDALFYFEYNTIISCLISVLISYIISTNYITKYLKGQINHKRNYAKYLSEIFLFNNRESIWIDFVKNFYFQSFKNYKKRLVYIITNPLIELIIALNSIFLIFIFGDYKFNFSDDVIKILTITLVIFFITSFKKTRFLGEPQRYVYLAIPLISIFGTKFSENLSATQLIFVLAPNLLLFMINRILSRKSKKISYFDVIEYFNSHKRDKIDYLLCDNSNVAKSLLIFNFKVFRFDLSKPMNSMNDFNQFHSESYELLNLESLKIFNNNEKINLKLFTNNRIDEIRDNGLLSDCIEIKRFKNYTLYEVQ